MCPPPPMGAGFRREKRTKKRAAGFPAQRQRAGVHRPTAQGLSGRAGSPDALHRSRISVAERILRKFQRQAPRRVSQPGGVLLPGPRQGAGRELAAALQHAAAAQQPGVSDAGGVCGEGGVMASKELRLSLCGPPVRRKISGPEDKESRAQVPAPDRLVTRVGAQVARQRCPILRAGKEDAIIQSSRRKRPFEGAASLGRDSILPRGPQNGGRSLSWSRACDRHLLVSLGHTRALEIGHPSL